MSSESLQKPLTEKPTIGVLGFGLMGRAFAQRFQQQGYDVWVYNRTQTNLAQWQKQWPNIHFAPSVSTLLTQTQLVFCLLSDAQAVNQTLSNELIHATTNNGHDLPLLVMSGTIAADQSQALGQRLQHTHMPYLEMPVLGSLPEVSQGRLILMMAGDDVLLERFSPIWDLLGTQRQYFGDLGSAMTVKLAMNQLILSLSSAFAFSLNLCRSQHIDIDKFMALLRASAVYAPTYDKKLDKMRRGEYGQANFPIQHLLKDGDLVAQQAAGAGINTDYIHAMLAVIQGLIDQGVKDVDYSVLCEGYQPTSIQNTR